MWNSNSAPNWSGVAGEGGGGGAPSVLYITPDPPSVLENPSIGIVDSNIVPLPTTYKTLHVGTLTTDEPPIDVRNWSLYPATNNVTAVLDEFGTPHINMSGFADVECRNLNVKATLLPLGGGAITSQSIDSFVGNIGTLTAGGVTISDNLTVNGSTVLDGGTLHGTSIGSLPVGGVNTVRLDVLPIGIAMASAGLPIEIVAGSTCGITSGGATTVTAGGVVSIAAGDYVEINSSDIHCVNTTNGVDATTLAVGSITPAFHGFLPLRITGGSQGVVLTEGLSISTNNAYIPSYVSVDAWDEAEVCAVGLTRRYENVSYTSAVISRGMNPKIGIIFWDAHTQYYVWNYVVSEASGLPLVYLCIADVQSATPPDEDERNWALQAGGYTPDFYWTPGEVCNQALTYLGIPEDRFTYSLARPAAHGDEGLYILKQDQATQNLIAQGLIYDSVINPPPFPPITGDLNMNGYDITNIGTAYANNVTTDELAVNTIGIKSAENVTFSNNISLNGNDIGSVDVMGANRVNTDTFSAFNNSTINVANTMALGSNNLSANAVSSNNTYTNNLASLTGTTINLNSNILSSGKDISGVGTYQGSNVNTTNATFQNLNGVGGTLKIGTNVDMQTHDIINAGSISTTTINATTGNIVNVDSTTTSASTLNVYTITNPDTDPIDVLTSFNMNNNAIDSVSTLTATTVNTNNITNVNGDPIEVTRALTMNYNSIDNVSNCDIQNAYVKNFSTLGGIPTTVNAIFNWQGAAYPTGSKSQFTNTYTNNITNSASTPVDYGVAINMANHNINAVDILTASRVNTATLGSTTSSISLVSPITASNVNITGLNTIQASIGNITTGNIPTINTGTISNGANVINVTSAIDLNLKNLNNVNILRAVEGQFGSIAPQTGSTYINMSNSQLTNIDTVSTHNITSNTGTTTYGSSIDMGTHNITNADFLSVNNTGNIATLNSTTGNITNLNTYTVSNADHDPIDFQTTITMNNNIVDDAGAVYATLGAFNTLQARTVGGTHIDVNSNLNLGTNVIYGYVFDGHSVQIDYMTNHNPGGGPIEVGTDLQMNTHKLTNFSQLTSTSDFTLHSDHDIYVEASRLVCNATLDMNGNSIINLGGTSYTDLSVNNFKVDNITNYTTSPIQFSADTNYNGYSILGAALISIFGKSSANGQLLINSLTHAPTTTKDFTITVDNTTWNTVINALRDLSITSQNNLSLSGHSVSLAATLLGAGGITINSPYDDIVITGNMRMGSATNFTGINNLGSTTITTTNGNITNTNTNFLNTLNNTNVKMNCDLDMQTHNILNLGSFIISDLRLTSLEVNTISPNTTTQVQFTAPIQIVGNSTTDGALIVSSSAHVAGTPIDCSLSVNDSNFNTTLQSYAQLNLNSTNGGVFVNGRSVKLSSNLIGGGGITLDSPTDGITVQGNLSMDAGYEIQNVPNYSGNTMQLSGALSVNNIQTNGIADITIGGGLNLNSHIISNVSNIALKGNGPDADAAQINFTTSDRVVPSLTIVTDDNVGASNFTTTGDLNFNVANAMNIITGNGGGISGPGTLTIAFDAFVNNSTGTSFGGNLNMSNNTITGVAELDLVGDRHDPVINMTSSGASDITFAITTNPDLDTILQASNSLVIKGAPLEITSVDATGGASEIAINGTNITLNAGGHGEGNITLNGNVIYSGGGLTQNVVDIVGVDTGHPATLAMKSSHSVDPDFTIIVDNDTNVTTINSVETLNIGARGLTITTNTDFSGTDITNIGSLYARGLYDVAEGYISEFYSNNISPNGIANITIGGGLEFPANQSIIGINNIDVEGTDVYNPPKIFLSTSRDTTASLQISVEDDTSISHITAADQLYIDATAKTTVTSAGFAIVSSNNIDISGDEITLTAGGTESIFLDAGGSLNLSSGNNQTITCGGGGDADLSVDAANINLNGTVKPYYIVMNTGGTITNVADIQSTTAEHTTLSTNNLNANGISTITVGNNLALGTHNITGVGDIVAGTSHFSTTSTNTLNSNGAGFVTLGNNMSLAANSITNVNQITAAEVRTGLISPTSTTVMLNGILNMNAHPITNVTDITATSSHITTTNTNYLYADGIANITVGSNLAFASTKNISGVADTSTTSLHTNSITTQSGSYVTLGSNIVQSLPYSSTLSDLRCVDLTCSVGTTISVNSDLNMSSKTISDVDYITSHTVRQPFILFGTGNTGTSSAGALIAFLSTPYASATSYVVHLTYKGVPTGNTPLYVISQTANSFLFHGNNNENVSWTTYGYT